MWSQQEILLKICRFEVILLYVQITDSIPPNNQNQNTLLKIESFKQLYLRGGSNLSIRVGLDNEIQSNLTWSDLIYLY